MPCGWWIRAESLWWILKCQRNSPCLENWVQPPRGTPQLSSVMAAKGIPQPGYVRREPPRRRAVLEIYWGRGQLFHFRSHQQENKTALLNSYVSYLLRRAGAKVPCYISFYISYFWKTLDQNDLQIGRWFSPLQVSFAGSFTNPNVGLNNCFNLTRKLSSGEGWDLFAVIEVSFRLLLFFKTLSWTTGP